MRNNVVVLAFSGGLDTSYCIAYLSREMGLEVHAAVVNTGGFVREELQALEERATLLGAKSFKVLERTEDYYQKVVKYLIFGNVLKNNTYPLSVGAERISQAIALAEYAEEIDAGHIAHGSTGAGNDQIRFDVVFHVLIPNVNILTPIRDQQLSRQSEIDYLKENGVDESWEKAKYSVNRGLWGTTVGGEETLTSHLPLPEEAYVSQLTRSEPTELTLSFERGEISAVNGEAMRPVEAIQYVEEQAAPFAIGRGIHVGDTIVGIKGRVGFEAAAASIVIKAHHELEKHTLSKWQLHLKEQLGNSYGMFIHEAQYLDPVMRDLEAFLESTQRTVSGEVTLTLYPYRFEIQGIRSDYDAMNSRHGVYGEMNTQWSGEDVKGFIKIMANASRIFNQTAADT